MINILIISLAAYGFATSVQMLRGTYLNFKPFNCKFCMSFWSSLIYLYFLNFTINQIILYPFFVACIANFLKLIEDKIIGDGGIF